MNTPLTNEDVPLVRRLREHANGCEGFDIEARDMMLAAAEIERLRDALTKAVEIIKVWHNMDGCDEGTWQVYLRCAPEMKPIREVLSAPREVS